MGQAGGMRIRELPEPAEAQWRVQEANEYQCRNA